MATILSRHLIINRGVLRILNWKQLTAMARREDKNDSLERRRKWNERSASDGCPLAEISYEIVYGRYERHFTPIMIGFILAAGALVGVQTYPSMDGSPALSAIDNVSGSLTPLSLAAPSLSL